MLKIHLDLNWCHQESGLAASFGSQESFLLLVIGCCAVQFLGCIVKKNRNAPVFV